MGFGAVCICKSMPMFRRNILSPSSGAEVKGQGSRGLYSRACFSETSASTCKYTRRQNPWLLQQHEIHNLSERGRKPRTYCQDSKTTTEHGTSQAKTWVLTTTSRCVVWIRLYLTHQTHSGSRKAIINMWDFKFPRRRVWCSELSSAV
jgi:hypothetical protein